MKDMLAKALCLTRAFILGIRKLTKDHWPTYIPVFKTQNLSFPLVAKYLNLRNLGRKFPASYSNEICAKTWSTCVKHGTTIWPIWAACPFSIDTKKWQTTHLPVWQVVPVIPAGQVHWNLLTWSTQVPPFWHGLLAHSLISTEIKNCEHHMAVLLIAWLRVTG